MSFHLRSKRSWARGSAALALAACCLAATLQATAASSAPPLTGVVNINTASAEELQLLPGVGESRARAILATRKQQGGFSKVEDLTQVKGIGSSMLERMRPHVTLKGRTTARSGAVPRSSNAKAGGR